jgi:hypothetical protein
MEDEPYHIVKRIEVTNTSGRPLTFVLEPCASEYPIAPGETFIVEGKGPGDYACLEYEQKDDLLTAYACDGSDARILRRGGSILAGWTGIRVPDFQRMRDLDEPGW